MNSEYLRPVADHLWQSTLFALSAAFLTLALRRNRARVRHGVWLAASCKFLIPFSVLVTLGSRVAWRPAPAGVAPSWSIAVEDVGRRIASPALAPYRPVAPPSGSALPAILVCLWACGVLGLCAAWVIRWRRIQAVVRAGELVPMEAPIRAIKSATVQEPGVFGIWRPILLLPGGIFERLTAPQLRAVIAHELCHIRYRDNLSAAVHMLVETIFWFHPLVWWMGKRMLHERESACDEEVVRRGNDPEVYAKTILDVCKLYLESPLACVSGVTGANLKRRIDAILSHRASARLSLAKKMALALVGTAAVGAPIVIGMLNTTITRAQTAPAVRPKFEVASIKPCKTGGRGGISPPSPGRITVNCSTVMSLIGQSYILFGDGRTMNLQPEKVVPMEKSPTWINSDLYTIDAKAESNGGQVPGQAMMLGPMMQALLEDRFKLKIHRETKQVQVYAMTVEKGGLRLPAAPKNDCAPQDLDQGPTPPAPGKAPLLFCGFALVMSNGFDMRGATMAQLSTALSGRVDRKVIDKTGITGMFDIHLDWSNGELPSAPAPLPPPPEPGVPPPPGPSPAEVTAGYRMALRKIGLKLEPTQGPAEFLVIDHVERPSEN